MTIQYSISSTTNNNKCPHGFTLGSCPLCSGMGGGAPKDKNKPRKPGEMSYNECMAEWHKIQAQQKAKMQEEIDSQKTFMEKLFSSKPIVNIIEKIQKFQAKIIKNLEKAPKAIQVPTKTVLYTIRAIFSSAFNSINKIQNFVKNFSQNIFNLITNIAEKIPVVLSEIKNIIFLNTQKIILTPFKTILTLFVGKDSKQDDKKDKQRKKVKKILEKIFNFYFKEKNDNKQD